MTCGGGGDMVNYCLIGKGRSWVLFLLPDLKLYLPPPAVFVSSTARASRTGARRKRTSSSASPLPPPLFLLRPPPLRPAPLPRPPRWRRSSAGDQSRWRRGGSRSRLSPLLRPCRRSPRPWAGRAWSLCRSGRRKEKAAEARVKIRTHMSLSLM